MSASKNGKEFTRRVKEMASTLSHYGHHPSSSMSTCIAGSPWRKVSMFPLSRVQNVVATPNVGLFFWEPEVCKVVVRGHHPGILYTCKYRRAVKHQHAEFVKRKFVTTLTCLGRTFAAFRTGTSKCTNKRCRLKII